jgi:hypothetical protein
VCFPPVYDHFSLDDTKHSWRTTRHPI